MLVPEIVARSFVEISDASGVDTACKGLVAMLKARGAERIAPRVLRSVERILEQRARQKTCVYVANKEDEANAQKMAHELFGEKGIVSHDDSLIGGFVVRKGAALYDASFKKALVSVYRSFVK